MKAHLVQLDILWEDKLGNRAKVASLIERANPAPTDLVILPEMFDTGFSFHVGRTADSDGATLRFLQDLARSKSVYVHGSRTAVDQGRAMNLTTLIDQNGSILVEYEKIHPFGLGAPGEREADHFPGGSEVKCSTWNALRVCPAICYDLRFPEVFRKGLLAGAEMFIVPANWPATRASHYRALLIARAIENQAFVIGVNRVGRDPKVSYAGQSVVVSPTGEVLAEMDDREGVLGVEIDPTLVRDWRARFPAWRDHRLL
jgi:omega-amidase